jgi:pyrimidine operon attenuation protein / uracil phosphoribosyltransferase
MNAGKVILTSDRIRLTIKRLCHQILENHGDPQDLCIIGIQERGVLLAERIKIQLIEMLGERSFSYGKLDITFYRDDFRRIEIRPSKLLAHI